MVNLQEDLKLRIFEVVVLISLCIALTASSLAGGAGAEGSLKWRYLADSDYYSPPAVGPDGTIYFGSGNFLIALDADGQLKWKNKTGGLVSSPAIGPDGSIHAASTGLYCFNSNGTLRWTYSTGYYDFQTPAIGLNGTIYFPSENGNLYAFNPNGTIRWSYKIGYRPSSPAIDLNGTIYVCGNNSTYAINPDGTKKWSFVTGPAASPIIGSSKMIYIGSYLNGLYGLNQNGTLMWHNSTAKISSSPTVGPDGSIYVGSITGCIYAFTPDGKLKWCYPAKGAVRYPPTVGSDGVLYASADSDNYLYAINSNGSLRWQYQAGGIINSAPTLSPNGTLYVGSADKYLYAFNTSSRLANSSWPMFQHDAQHSGMAGWPPYIGISSNPSSKASKG